MNETKIQYALYHYLLRRGHKIIVPNVSWSYLAWEADIVSITKANYMNEFEVKTSKSDFERDFAKRKHSQFRNPRMARRIPNYFWYVAPIKAFPLCVPDYAGLIEVTKSRSGLSLEQIKKPKLIHKNKMVQDGIDAILKTIMFKYWNLSGELIRNNVQYGLF